jgi:chorismate mutase
MTAVATPLRSVTVTDSRRMPVTMSLRKCHALFIIKKQKTNEKENNQKTIIEKGNRMQYGCP